MWVKINKKKLDKMFPRIGGAWLVGSGWAPDDFYTEYMTHYSIFIVPTSRKGLGIVATWDDRRKMLDWGVKEELMEEITKLGLKLVEMEADDREIARVLWKFENSIKEEF